MCQTFRGGHCWGTESSRQVRLHLRDLQCDLDLFYCEKQLSCLSPPFFNLSTEVGISMDMWALSKRQVIQKDLTDFSEQRIMRGGCWIISRNRMNCGCCSHGEMHRWISAGDSDLWHLIESSVWLKEVDILTPLFWWNYKGMGKVEESDIEKRKIWTGARKGERVRGERRNLCI
jgi:hypothetical protein